MWSAQIGVNQVSFLLTWCNLPSILVEFNKHDSASWSNFTGTLAEKETSNDIIISFVASQWNDLSFYVCRGCVVKYPRPASFSVSLILQGKIFKDTIAPRLSKLRVFSLLPLVPVLREYQLVIFWIRSSSFLFFIKLCDETPVGTEFVLLRSTNLYAFRAHKRHC